MTMAWSSRQQRYTSAARQGGSGRSEEEIMHPTFVKLFLEADAAELLAEEEDKRRRANRARRTRSRMASRVAARDRERGPRR